MANGIPDFTPKRSGDIGAIARLMMQKQQMEQQFQSQKRQEQRQFFNDVLQAVQQGQQIASNAMRLSEERKKRQAISELAKTFEEPSQEAVVARPGGQPITFSETKRGMTQPLRRQAAAIKAGIQPRAEELFKKKTDGPERGTISGRDFTPKNLVLAGEKEPTAVMIDEVKVGQGLPGTFYLDGSPVPKEKLIGSRPFITPVIGIDPVSGLPISIPKTPSPKATPVETPSDKLAEGKGGSLELRAKAPKIYTTYENIKKKAFPENNKFLETSVTGGSAAAQVGHILEAVGEGEFTQIGLQSLGFYFAKMSGSNSQLSDREREVFENPLSLIDAVVNKGYKLAAGDLSPKMKQDLKNLSKLIEKKSLIQGQKIINGIKRQAVDATGSFWNAGLSKEFPSMKELIVTRKDMQEAMLNSAIKDSTDYTDEQIEQLGSFLGLPRRK